MLNLGLLALAAVIAFVERGWRRTLALVPAATVVGAVLYVIAGGPIMAATWIAAAVVALATRTATPAPFLAP